MRAQNILPVLSVCVAVMPLTAAAQNPPATVSLRQPDGMVLSTGNIYFTSHDGSTASVWRTAQGARPGQESLLYSEPNARFGDIVFAQVGGTWFGYFFAAKSGVGAASIKRVPLAGGAAVDIKTGIQNVDVFNNRRNLATDGASLYWQDVNSIRKTSIRGGGPDSVLDPSRANTPTAGIALRGPNLIYASVDEIRYVPTSGNAVTLPQVRTIARAASRVTALHAVSNGVYWGEDSGSIRRKVGTQITTLPSSPGLVPTALSTNGFIAGAAQAWSQCGGSSCRLQFDLPGGRWSTPIGGNALGVTVTSVGNVFWGDSAGIHKQAF